MSKRSTEGFVIALVPVLVVLLIVGAGVSYFLKNSNIKIENPLSTTPSGEEGKGGGDQAPGGAEGGNQVPNDWLVFQNKTYNYEVSYPVKFHVQGKNEPPYPPPPVTQAFSFTYDNGEHCDFQIMASTNIEGFRGEIASIRDEGKNTESLVNLAGVPVIVFDAQGGDAIDRSYYIDQNNPHLRMGYNYRPAAKYSQECADTVAKMVASFKLL